MPYGPVSAKVNNKVEGLHYRFYNDKDVEFLDVTSPSGMRTYTRSLFLRAGEGRARPVPGCEIRIDTPVSRGYYCDLRIGRPLEEGDVTAIWRRMKEIVAADIPFRRIQCPTEDAIEMFRQAGMKSKVRLLESSGSIYTHYYRLDDTVDYFYGSLLTSTGGLKVFDVMKYYDGLLLRIPSRKDPEQLAEMVHQEKMLEIFREHHRWQDIVGLSTVGDFNHACQEGHATDLINVAEALQEKKNSPHRRRNPFAARPEAHPDCRTFVEREDHVQQAALHPADGQRDEAVSRFAGRLFRGPRTDAEGRARGSMTSSRSTRWTCLSSTAS